MENKILNAFFEGECIDAYKIFGAQRKDNEIHFTLWAPNALSVQVCINDTTIEMKQCRETGIWTAVTSDFEENTTYFYRIQKRNGEFVEKIDPFSFMCTLEDTVQSVICDKSYAWKDAAWMKKRTINLNTPLNIYEVHLNAWKTYEKNTYKDIVHDLIAYVKKHHYTHIELMPLHEYPYDGSWGYQTCGLYAITSRYGTLEDFKYFVNECHKANIGIILDFVMIHFASDKFGLLKLDGTPLYEYEKEELAFSEWGSANFDLCKKEVQSYLMSAASYFIEEMHVDGLRMDAMANAFYYQGSVGKGENLEAISFVRKMNKKLKETYPNVMLIAEDSTAYPNVTKSYEKGGMGFDYKWDMGWMNDTLSYLGKDPVYRKWHHHEITFSMAYFYNEKYLLPFSHDEVVHGKNTIVNKMWGSYEQKFAQARMLYTYMFTHPGKKLNFMGNEIGMLREFDEKREVDWNLLSYPMHDSFQKYIDALHSLYVTTSLLYENEYDYHFFEWIDADNCDENLYSYMRKNEEYTMVVILNASPNTYYKHPFGVKESGFYKEILNSEEDIYSGCNIINKKIICAKKGECNYKEYYIEVDVAPFAGIVLMHKNRKEK